MSFFNNLFQGDDKKKGGNKLGGNGSGGGGPKNPFAGMGQKKFQGDGQSLGGNNPGKLIHIELKKPGTLGLKVEKRPGGGTAIVSMVVPGSQADDADLMRGDILCFAGSEGKSEIMYKDFLDMAKSGQRPVVFDVRRIQTKTAATKGKSADAFAKRQAVIAAAEAREKAHKKKEKGVTKGEKKQLPVILSAAEKRQKDLERERDVQLQQQEQPRTEEARRAMEAAKRNEAELACQLGYNPYETNKSTAGQARNATVTVQQGAIGGGSTGTTKKKEPESIPTVRPPAATPAAKEENETQSTEDAQILANTPEFYETYTTIVTGNANNDAVVKAFGIMRTLATNATTKGQVADESATKFRRVRLSNAKIKAAIVDVAGALELMMLFGFELTEEGGESYLVYPLGDSGPEFLPAAMRQMERYEKSA